MALAAAPFGARPRGGKQVGTIWGTLNGTHIAFGKGHPIYEVADGWMPLQDNTDTNQIGIVGFACNGLAADTGGKLECWKAEPDNIFEMQSATAASTWGTEAAACMACGDFVYGAVNATTGLSSTSITNTSATTAHAPLVVRGYAQIPGNDVNSATSYPVLLVSVSRYDAKGFQSIHTS